MNDETTDTKYTFSVKEEIDPPSYEEGFAEGFSRGWHECLEYVKKITSEQEESK